jgi:pteridine reductase
MELKEATAIITGSTGRLGSAIAEAVARAGCDCICHYNSDEKAAQRLAGRLTEMGRRAAAVAADLTKPEQINDFFARAAEFGTLRVLINSAAVFSKQPLEKVTFQQAQRIFNLNLTAPILTSRLFARAAGLGKIINIADVGGIRPWAGYVLYCSAKAGLLGATKALAKELAPAICVNAVAPGIVTWPNDFDEAEKKRQLSFIPAARIAAADEVTDAVIFLLKNDYITGQVLNVDGGRCI